MNIESTRLQIASLQEALLSSHPKLPTLLREIHTAIKNDPEQVTLLSEEEISVIVSGLSRQTQTELVASSASSKKKKINLDDL